MNSTTLPAATGFATCIQASPDKIPILTPGEVTPEVLRQFEIKCNSFFINKDKLEAKDYVARIATGIQDTNLQDFYQTSITRFNAMTFAGFMVEFRARCLPETWVDDVRNIVLGTKHIAGPIADWVGTMCAHNTVLRGTDHHLDEDALRRQLEANFMPEFRIHYNDSTIGEEKLFVKWCSRLKVLDEKVTRRREQGRRDAERARREADEAAGRFKRTASSAGLTEPSRRANTSAPIRSGSSSSSTVKRLPRLTDAERNLLADFQGCTKCRVFFVAKHSHDDCEFADANTYQPLTIAMADAAKRRGIVQPIAPKAKPTPTGFTIAATTPYVPAASTSAAAAAPVAAIMGSMSYNSSAVMPPINDSSILGDGGSDSSRDLDDSVSHHTIVTPPPTRAPFVSSHLVWRCALDIPSSIDRLIVDGLIDSGSHTVLIRPSSPTSPDFGVVHCTNQ